MDNDPKNDKYDDDDDTPRVGETVRLDEDPRFKKSASAAPDNQSDDDPPETLSIKELYAWFNKSFFTTYISGKYKVVRENPDGTIEIMDRSDFVVGKAHIRRIIVSPETGVGTLTQMAQLWLKSEERRRYEYGFDFDVSAVENRNGKYNLFKGYKLGSGKPGDVAPYLGLMRNVISSDNERDFTILEALIAQMFQEPDKKPGIVVVIRGDEGVGKSFFVEKLAELMYPYAFKTSNPDMIFGDHNGQLKHVILLHLEEAVWPGGKKAESLLKDMITSPTIPIDEKFIPVYSVPNHLHLFLTGNPEWLIAAGFKARRIFALRASEAHIKDVTYFAEIDKWFRNGGDAALLHHFLNLDFKASLARFGISDLRLLPITGEHIEQQKQSLSGVKEWGYNWVELGEWPYGEVRGGHCFVIKSLLYHDYVKSSLGKRHPLSERQFGIQFLALFPLVIDGNKQYSINGRVKSVIGVDAQERNSARKQADAYDIPPIDELRKVMDSNFGGESEWNVKSEWTIRHGSNNVDLDSKEAF